MIKIVNSTSLQLASLFANFFMQVLKYIITYISMYFTTYVKSRINNGSGPQERIKILGGVICNKGA